MKLFFILLLLATSGVASPIAPPTTRAIAMGRFQVWFYKDKPLDFVSGGVGISVAPAPCDARHSSEGCRYEGVNNQALVTISAPGKPSFVVATDDQAEYYRIAVVQLDRRDWRAGVIIENQSGGSAGDVTEYVIRPDGDGFRRVLLDGQAHFKLQGELADLPRDLSGDGVVDFVLRDGRFADVFGCNACTPRPPLIFTIRNAEAVEVSREPVFAPIFRKDMAVNAATCRSRQGADGNGACAAYAADAARLGVFKAAMQNVTAWQQRDVRLRGTNFPAELRAFLRTNGYIG